MISKYIQQKMRSGRIHKGDWQLLVNEDWMGLTLDVRGSVDTISSRWKNCCSQIITSTRSFSPLLFLTFLTLSFLSSVPFSPPLTFVYFSSKCRFWIGTGGHRPTQHSPTAAVCSSTASAAAVAITWHYSSWVVPPHFQTALLCFGRAHMKFPSACALDWRDSSLQVYGLAQLDLATEIE